MSWDHNRYKATCRKCGRQGVCIESSDDWNRSETRWEGFAEIAPSAEAIYRKRYDARDRIPQCECGSSDISVDRSSRLDD